MSGAASEPSRARPHDADQDRPSAFAEGSGPLGGSERYRQYVEYTRRHRAKLNNLMGRPGPSTVVSCRWTWGRWGVKGNDGKYHSAARLHGGDATTSRDPGHWIAGVHPAHQAAARMAIHHQLQVFQAAYRFQCLSGHEGRTDSEPADLFRRRDRDGAQHDPDRRRHRRWI